MKKLIKLLGVAALVAVIGFAIVACDHAVNSTGNSSSTGGQGPGTGPGTGPGGGTGGSAADTNPDLAVPSSSSAIADFPASKNYSAVTEDQVDELKAELKDALDELKEMDLTQMMPSISILSNSILSPSLKIGRAVARATQTETVEYYLSDEESREMLEYYAETEGINIPSSAKLNGFVKATVSYDDYDGYPMSVNGTAKVRFESTQEPIVEEGVEVLGYVTCEATANNVRITDENDMSGSASYTVKYAINCAYPNDKYWAKIIGDMTCTANLSNGNVTINASFKVYGSSPGAMADVTITVKTTDGGETITVTYTGLD